MHLPFSWWSVKGSPSYGPWISKKRVFVFCPQHNFGIFWWMFLKLCVCVHHNMPLCTCHFHDDLLRGPQVMALELVKKGCLCFVRSIILASFDECFSNCVYVFIIICHCAPVIFMMWSGEGSSSYGPWINDKRCFCFVRSITLTCYDESFSNLVYVFIIICNCVAVIFMMIGWGVSELWPLNL